MIEVDLIRAFFDERATLGMLKVKGVSHDPLFTLENPWRHNLKDSSIPDGEYMCAPFSGVKYKKVYQVLDVPGRSYILFHWGNFESDTEGCILVGLGAGAIQDRPAVLNSRLGFKKFKSIIGDNEFKLNIR